MLINMWGAFIKKYMGKDWKLGQQPSSAKGIAQAKDKTPASAGRQQQQQQKGVLSPHADGKVSTWRIQGSLHNFRA